jgi:hypothetical protein
MQAKQDFFSPHPLWTGMGKTCPFFINRKLSHCTTPNCNCSEGIIIKDVCFFHDLLKGPDFQYIYDPEKKKASQWKAIVEKVAQFYKPGQDQPEYSLPQVDNNYRTNHRKVCRPVWMTALGVPAVKEMYELIEGQAAAVYRR